MAKGHKPVAGSRGFWPKKRAKRIYPRLNSLPSEKTTPVGFAVYKAGMTQATVVDERKISATSGQEIVKPVTILDAPSLVVCGVKTYKRDHNGLKNIHTIWAETLSKDLSRKTRIPKKPKKTEVNLEEIDDIRLLVHTKPRESGIRKKTPELFEIPIGGDIQKKWEYAQQRLGSELKVSEVFEEGDYIDVISITKGKGFQGPVKRFGIKIRSRKNQGKRRHVGTLGSVGVARVLPGKLAMAGQLGFQRRTEYNKRILKLGTDGLKIKGDWLGYGLVKGDYIIIEGSIPGPKKRLIMLRKPVRKKAKQSWELKNVFLDSQQGV